MLLPSAPYLILSMAVLASKCSTSPTRSPNETLPDEPCGCTYSDHNCDCSCHHLGNSGVLPPLPRNLTSCPHFSYEMEDGSFESVPPNFFTSVGSVDTFFFDSVDVNFDNYLPESRDLSPFKGVTFTSEVYLVLLKVKVEGSFNWHSLAELQPGPGARASVQAMKTHIEELTSDFSAVCAGSVDTVRMTQCRMKKLGERVFAAHKNLTVVNLGKNMIKEIKRSHFPKPALKLKQIVLSKNLITTLPECMFDDMPALEMVDLTGNHFSTMDENTFGPFFNRILFVGIQDFRLDCDCRIRWLKTESVISGQNSMEAATCKSPNYQHIQHLSDVKATDLEC